MAEDDLISCENYPVLVTKCSQVILYISNGVTLANGNTQTQTPVARLVQLQNKKTQKLFRLPQKQLKMTRLPVKEVDLVRLITCKSTQVG